MVHSDGTHAWVAAALIPINAYEAGQATRRGHCYVDITMRITVLETYCSACRRPYDDVKDDSCPAAISNDHLIGGPTGRRKRRSNAL